MTAMTADEALKLLGLSPDCSHVELQKAYYERSRETHPDTGKGETAAQARLNEAREVAAAYIADHKALVPTKFEQSLQEFERKLVAEQAARQADEIVGRAIRRSQRRFRYPKYLAFLFAALAAAIGWLRDNILPGLMGQIIPIELNDVLRDQFKVMALLLAACGGVLHFISQRHAILLETAKENLDDVEICAEELASVLDYEDRTEIRQGSIPERRRHDPFMPFSILWGLDPADQKKLLIAKGLEHGLLEGIGPKNILPASERLFKITFSPSQFKPRPREPGPPPTPMPLSAAVVMTFMMLAVGGGLGLWARSISSGWAYVPGVFSVIFLLCSFGGVAAAVEAIREKRKAN